MNVNFILLFISIGNEKFVLIFKDYCKECKDFTDYDVVLESQTIMKQVENIKKRHQIK